MNLFHFTSKDLLLGNRGHHLSYSAFKLAMLTGQLSLLAFVVTTGYILFDLYYEVYHSWPLLSVAALLSLASLVLNKQGYYFPAKLTLGLSTNLTIFYFSSIEPVETGLSFMFIICALGAISTLGFEQKRLAILFVSLSLILFLFSTVIDLDLFTRRQFSTEYVRVNMIINFMATFAAATLIFYFLLSLNYHSERALRENEKRLHDNNEELVKVNKELDRFVYSAAHDLRSPISSVRGLISLVKLSPNPLDAKSYVDMMDKQLIGLNKFIDDIVLYSRNTRVALKTDSIHLKKLVSEILTSLQFYPGSEKVHVDVHIPEDATLKSDPTRIQIVLANLISNAFKYSNHANDNAFIKIKTTKTPTHVEVSIQDNGTGIDDQYLPHIFDMFFQANDKSDGSGLGLYIVKETLEKIQGKIRVQSELGKGTEFIVTLPWEITEALHE
jgi:signal transduction histidine kinase